MKNILPRYSTVSPASDNPLTISNTNLSNRIIDHHSKNEQTALHTTTKILFDRAVRNTPVNKNTNELSAEALLRIAMAQGGGINTIVQGLARDLVIKKRPEDDFNTIRNAFNLIQNPTSEEIYHYNLAVTAQNESIDDTTSSLHLGVSVVTSLMGAIVAILTAMPDSGTTSTNTNDTQATVNSDTKKLTALVLSTCITLIGGVRSAVDNYQEAKKVKPYVAAPQEDDGASVVQTGSMRNV